MFYADTFCTHAEEFGEDGHWHIYQGVCTITGEKYSVRVPGRELFAYRQGKSIQDAMSSLSAEDREFLISGVSPAGWKKIFPGEA